MAYASFRRVLVARSFNTLGNSVQIVAAGWLVYHLSGSALNVGLLSVVALASSLLGSPLGGVLADRFAVQRMAAVLTLLQVIPAAVMAILAFSGSLTVPLIFLIVFCGSIPSSLSQPMVQVFLPRIVPKDLGRELFSDLSAAYHFAQFGGVLLGGVVTDQLGVGYAFAFNAFSFAIFALAIARSKLVQKPPAEDSPAAKERFSMRDGLRIGWPIRLVRTVFIACLAFYSIVYPISELLPAIAAQHGASATLVGILAAAFVSGSIIGNPPLRRYVTSGRSAERVISGGLVLGSLTAVAMGLTNTLATTIVLLVVLGVAAEMVYLACVNALQLYLPAQIQGRMVGLFFTTVRVGGGVGAFAVGYLFDLLGIGTSMALVGLVTLPLGLWLFARQRGPDLGQIKTS
ncbi:MAG: MFS transporter [Solirubrobacteraceae bacterium]|nr:MFS transporter [Solirubrobacteraceae bacterium]